ncbi:hypothetical protein VPH35_007878 [Triticum aestivum]
MPPPSMLHSGHHTHVGATRPPICNLGSLDKFIYAIFKRSDAVKSSCTPLSSLHSTKCIRCSAETFAMATFVCFCIHCPLGTCVNVQEGEAMEFIVGNYM